MPAPLAVDKEQTGALENPRWEDFAKHIVAGEYQTKAYQLAFGTTADSARQSASDLIRIPAVANRISELRMLGLGESPVLTLQDKRRILAEKVRGKPMDELTHAVQLKALELDAKLAGELDGASGDRVTLQFFAITGSQEQDEKPVEGPVVDV